MTRTHTVVDTPLCLMTIVAQDGALAALQLHEQGHHLPAAALGVRDDSTLPDVREQMLEYFAGERQEFDVVLAPIGTPFQAAVWAALRTVPYGTTTTYGALAAQIGRPTAVRAVGGANGRNPVGVIVPCHRVVGADGTLTGYAGGIERKRFLLDLETRQSPLLAGTPARAASPR